MEKNTKPQNPKSTANLGIIDSSNKQTKSPYRWNAGQFTIILILGLAKTRQPLKSTFTSMLTVAKTSGCGYNLELEQTLCQYSFYGWGKTKLNYTSSSVDQHH